MTNPNYSHITVVADRSGSMNAIRSDAEGAINAFIAEQQKAPGRASLTLVDFDTQEPQRMVFTGDIEHAPIYSLEPRGGTPLRDAVGQAIVSTGQALAAMPEDERPANVFVVIQTDGQENSSREWTQHALNAAIKLHEDTYKWTFIFLATGSEAWSQGEAFKGTQMHANNSVHNTGGGHSHTASVGYVGQSITATRGGQRIASYAATVADDGTVEKRDTE